MTTRLAKCIAVLTLTLSVLMTVPASASASVVRKSQYRVWIGQVQRHGKHFDYAGRPCAAETDALCAG